LTVTTNTTRQGHVQKLSEKAEAAIKEVRAQNKAHRRHNTPVLGDHQDDNEDVEEGLNSDGAEDDDEEGDEDANDEADEEHADNLPARKTKNNLPRSTHTVKTSRQGGQRQRKPSEKIQLQSK
jgi:hypothetical protein